MSEFKEKLQEMKEGIISNIEDNPALIPSELAVDDATEAMPLQEEPHNIQLSSNERNEKGHRKRRNLKDKLEIVLADNRAKEVQQQQLLSYIQEQERRLADAQARAEQNAHYSNIYYEQGLENEEQRILVELESAKESGDIKREVEIHKRLADIAAQKQTQLLSKTLQKQQPQPASYQPSDYYQEPLYVPQVVNEEPTNEYFEDWLEENPWANPQSPEFDQNLSAEVNDIAMELNKNLKFRRHGDMIGTPEYYNALSNMMNERYGGSVDNNVYYNDNEYRSTPAAYEYEVAPVSKKGSTMADRYVSNTQNRSPRQQFALTKDEIEVAARLAPVLSNIYNRQFTTEEAMAEYYKQKKAGTARHSY